MASGEGRGMCLHVGGQHYLSPWTFELFLFSGCYTEAASLTDEYVFVQILVCTSKMRVS